MTKYDNNIIPADEFFFIPQSDYADADTSTVQQPPLGTGAYEVACMPLYIADTRPTATMRGAVRSVNPSVGRVLMNTETHEPIGTCGSQYVPIQNKVVRDAAWKALTSQVPAHLLKDIKQNEYVEDNGAFYRCDWNIPGYSGQIRQQDGSVANLSLHVLIVNPHGYSSDKIMIAAKDDTCDNIILLNEVSESGTRRTEGFDPAVRTERAIEDIKLFADRVNELRDYSDISMGPRKFQRLLKQSRFSDTQIDAMVDHYVSETHIRGNNVWNAISTLTAWSTHNELCHVRNSDNVDNEMQSLTKRMYRVSKIMASQAFSEVLA